MSDCLCFRGPHSNPAFVSCPPRGLRLLRLACITLGFVLASGSALAEEIRISGTGGLLAVVQKLAETYRGGDPDVTVRMVPSLGSSGAIKAIQGGALEIAIIARPLKDDEKASGLRSLEFARSPFVFVTHPSTGMTSVGIREVGAYLSDPQKYWPDGRPVRPILRPESDSDTVLLRAISAEMNDAITATRARKGLVTAATDQDSADAIERVPGSLGAITLALVLAEQRKVKVLALDGVSPSLAALSSGRYRLSKTFYLVTGPQPARGTVAFIDHLRSPAAAKAILQYGAQVAGTAATQ